MENLQKNKNGNLVGWLVINKPKGIGSTTVVNMVKKKLGLRKVGHAGTLDPDATGVLPVALGEATKTVRFVGDTLKKYQFSLCLGSSTDTDDASGTILNYSISIPETAEIKKAFERFKGIIDQVPPKMSAIKINGQRAYKLFRKDHNFEMPVKRVLMKDINLVETEDKSTVTIEVTCGKGFYIRSLARDIGNYLKCYGHADNIRRLEYGPFCLSHSIDIDVLKEKQNSSFKQKILPLEFVLQNVPKIECLKNNLRDVLNGNSIYIEKIEVPDHEIACLFYEGKLLAYGRVNDQIFSPSRVFKK